MHQNAFQKVRVVGIEDGSFKKGISKTAVLAAVLFEGSGIEDVRFTRVKVDGLDATEKVEKILNEWNFEAVMLAGVSFAGFNIVDPTVLFEKFRKPLVIVSRDKPDNKAVKQALIRHFKDWQIRWNVFRKLGPIYKVTTLPRAFPIYVETVGGTAQWAKCLTIALTVIGRIPEPIRIARLIARGLTIQKG